MNMSVPAISDVRVMIPLYANHRGGAATPFTALLFAAFAALLPAACGRSVESRLEAAPTDRLTVLEGATMGGRYTVKLVDLAPALAASDLHDEIEVALRRINDSMSTFVDDSELMRFNRSTSTDWMAASPALVEVTAEAQRVSALTDGAFDVTVGPLVNLWGFGPDLRPEAVPAADDIEAAHERVGFRLLETRDEPPALRKHRPDIYVDLSAIAAGYAADVLSALLDARGVKNYVVDVTGELRVLGHNPQGQPWAIAVERPVPEVRSAERVLQIDGAGVATSGDYRNWFEVDGRRYSHIIDPRTARPVSHGLAAVTIVAPTAMRADALATGLMVLGPEAGYELAAREGIAALFIVREGRGFTERATPAVGAYAR